MPKTKIDQTYTVEADQQQWLETMARQYDLPDASKALRILIDFAIQDGDEAAIFETIRCLRCD